MALSIGVSRGTKIQVGTNGVLNVVAVQRGNSVTVEFNGRTYEVTDQARVELMDETFVSYGLRHHDASQRPRLAFEAPTHVRIRTI